MMFLCEMKSSIQKGILHNRLRPSIGISKSRIVSLKIHAVKFSVTEIAVPISNENKKQSSEESGRLSQTTTVLIPPHLSPYLPTSTPMAAALLSLLGIAGAVTYFFTRKRASSSTLTSSSDSEEVQLKALQDAVLNARQAAQEIRSRLYQSRVSAMKPSSIDIRDGKLEASEKQTGTSDTSDAALLLDERAAGEALKVAEALEKELKAVSDSIREREQEISEARDVAETQSESARLALQESQRKVLLLEAMVTALRDRLREEESRNIELQAEVSAGRIALEESEVMRAQVEAKAAELRDELVEAQTKLAQAESHSQELELKLKELSEYSGKLEGKVLELQEDLQHREQLVMQTAQEVERRMREVQEAADLSQSNLLQLQGQLDAQSGELVHVAQQLQNAERRAAEAVERSSAERMAMFEASEAAVLQYKAKQAEVDEMKMQLKRAADKADADAAERSAEMYRMRAAMESRLSEARQEVAAADQALKGLRREMEGLLQGEQLKQLLDEAAAATRNASVLWGAQHGRSGAVGASDDACRELEGLRQRSQHLASEISLRQSELQRLQQLAGPRLAPWVQTQVRELEGRAASLRVELERAEEAWEKHGTGAQALSRLQRELSQVVMDAAAIYRGAMSPEVQMRERSLRGEVQDRETELRGLVAEISRLERQVSVPHQTLRTDPFAISASSSLRLGGGEISTSDLIRDKLRDLLRQREVDMTLMKQREKDLELKAQANALNAAYQEQIKTMKQQLAEQVRNMEESWKLQLSANQNALAQVANQKQSLAAQATMSAAQVRQQLLELQALRDSLASQSLELADLRAAYEGGRVMAAQSVKESMSEVASLSNQVKKLEELLQDRELERLTAQEASEQLRRQQESLLKQQQQLEAEVRSRQQVQEQMLLRERELVRQQAAEREKMQAEIKEVASRQQREQQLSRQLQPPPSPWVPSPTTSSLQSAKASPPAAAAAGSTASPEASYASSAFKLPDNDFAVKRFSPAASAAPILSPTSEPSSQFSSIPLSSSSSTDSVSSSVVQSPTNDIKSSPVTVSAWGVKSPTPTLPAAPTTSREQSLGQTPLRPPASKTHTSQPDSLPTSAPEASGGGVIIPAAASEAAAAGALLKDLFSVTQSSQPYSSPSPHSDTLHPSTPLNPAFKTVQDLRQMNKPTPLPITDSATIVDVKSKQPQPLNPLVDSQAPFYLEMSSSLTAEAESGDTRTKQDPNSSSSSQRLAPSAGISDTTVSSASSMSSGSLSTAPASLSSTSAVGSTSSNAASSRKGNGGKPFEMAPSSTWGRPGEFTPKAQAPPHINGTFSQSATPPASSSPAPPSTGSTAARGLDGVQPSSSTSIPPGASSVMMGNGQTSSAFPSEDEIGDEIMRITQALVQRAGPQTGTSSTAVSNKASATGTQQRAASALIMVTGAHMMPHVAKAEKGGEDAYMIAGDGAAIVIADGVGGWAEDNVDPALYSRTFVQKCVEAINWDLGSEITSSKLVSSMAYAQDQVKVPGSCTACLFSISSSRNTLEVANLGDSGLRVIREGAVVFATRQQEHQFNMPFQLASFEVLPDTDAAKDAEKYSFQLMDGDVVIAGSDGLFDNLWDEQVSAQVNAFVAGMRSEGLSRPNPAAAQSLAQSLAAAAHSAARDPTSRTPWSIESAAAASQDSTAAGGGGLGLMTSFISRMFPKGGGKMDDVTVVVAFVTAKH
ncbi:hypothetical protein CEUSTIGMA_g4675.t1 [Chlamydomonas eustigma]|uniref:PPM-type phosphatase domain-containing protein n=1 Tax=Chlamydomonas eustigma TaxID=1157962 RepID=A0A250X2R6_9CHLO|nr:hypothetical protein CEUSTIGMA_g4675.t1 [Chlamydomonas eustigma]|eukprot:GAX77229.1 hypothetical protein CEUSTIGMA_g4675.t1 [Chlamydomonas eustigma]